MRALDQAVKELQELQDPQTDITRAPERHRIMLDLKDCFGDASPHPTVDPASYATCRTISLSALVGIKRSELVAYWGPPSVGGKNSEQAIWTFGNPGNYLFCGFLPDLRAAAQAQDQTDLRCMGFSWITKPAGAP
jgi:hypothetical protein